MLPAEPWGLPVGLGPIQTPLHQSMQSGTPYHLLAGTHTRTQLPAVQGIRYLCKETVQNQLPCRKFLWCSTVRTQDSSKAGGNSKPSAKPVHKSTATKQWLEYNRPTAPTYTTYYPATRHAFELLDSELGPKEPPESARLPLAWGPSNTALAADTAGLGPTRVQSTHLNLPPPASHCRAMLNKLRTATEAATGT